MKARAPLEVNLAENTEAFRKINLVIQSAHAMFQALDMALSGAEDDHGRKFIPLPTSKEME